MRYYKNKTYKDTLTNKELLFIASDEEVHLFRDKESKRIMHYLRCDLRSVVELITPEDIWKELYSRVNGKHFGYLEFKNILKKRIKQLEVAKS